MDDHVADRLLALNRRFYDTFAGAFSDSRAPSEPGLARILAAVGAGSRVLDLGCGQGRLATLLSPACRYVGVDFAEGMLRLAQQAATEASLADVRFIAADLVADPWPDVLADTFDWVFLRAVLHHIPGYQRRLALLRRAADALAPAGTLVLANWQFDKIPRLMRRRLPWDEVGLAPGDVERGDYLLDWQREGRGVRYVHLIDGEETRRLVADAGLGIAHLFSADGHTNDLTLYALLHRQERISRP